MNSVQGEECPVCWRNYSADLVPVALQCGHSFCRDCCTTTMKRCPLCRQRLDRDYPRVPNYSLLSLVESIGKDKKETKDQEAQTERQPRPFRPRPAAGTESTPSAMALSAIVKLTRVQSMLAKAFSVNSNRLTN